MNKHVAFLLIVLLLTVFGVFVCVADVIRHGQLHVMNGVVGGGSLLLAIAFALPLRLKQALETLTPFLDKMRKADVG